MEEKVYKLSYPAVEIDRRLKAIDDIPTKISQLLNDSNFVNERQLATKQDNLVEGEGISIEGNVISCTHDKTLYKVVTELPEVGEEHKIYLIVSTEQEENNIYNEWAYINNAWEMLGTYKATINLEPYVLKSEMANVQFDTYKQYAQACGKNGYNETQYKKAQCFLYEPFMINSASGGVTTIPDAFLNDSGNGFFVDYYWKYAYLTGGIPIKTISWDSQNRPNKLAPVYDATQTYTINFSTKTIKRD